MSAWDQDASYFFFGGALPAEIYFFYTKKVALKFEGARVQVYRAGVGTNQGAKRELE